VVGAGVAGVLVGGGVAKDEAGDVVGAGVAGVLVGGGVAGACAPYTAA